MNATVTLPKTLAVNIPVVRQQLADLCELPIWTCWRYVQKPGRPKPDKVPIVPQTKIERWAKSNDPSTWGYFGAAAAVCEYKQYAGLMFKVSRELGVIFVDLDDCRNPQTGTIDEWAQVIIGKLNSYTELSPSGRGLHILARGSIPRNHGTRPVELYCEKRLATVTGHVLEVRNVSRS